MQIVPSAIEVDGVVVETLSIKSADVGDEVKDRYLGEANSAVYLMRPDQHVAARWTVFDQSKVEAALRRAIGH